MADPWGIVLVPAEGDPGGLLAAHRLRLPPGPQAAVSVTRSAIPPEVYGWNASSIVWPHALALWWDGALVPEGWDRARRVYREAIRASGGTPVGAARLDYPSWARVAEYASWMVLWHPPLASRVVLLDLVDGRLVEREL